MVAVGLRVMREVVLAVALHYKGEFPRYFPGISDELIFSHLYNID